MERESVDDVLEIVGAYGPWGDDVNVDLRYQIVLADEVKRLRQLYGMAVKGRQEMRDARSTSPTAKQSAQAREGEDMMIKCTHPNCECLDYCEITNSEVWRAQQAKRVFRQNGSCREPAKTQCPLERVRALEEAIRPFAELVLTTSGRIPYERLSLANWHALMKAYMPNAGGNT